VIKYSLNTRARTHTHTHFYVQPEDGFYEPKHVVVKEINEVVLNYILLL